MIISIFKRKEKLFTFSILHFSFLFFLNFFFLLFIIVIIFSFFLVKLLCQKHIFFKIMKKSHALRWLQSSLQNNFQLGIWSNDNLSSQRVLPLYESMGSIPKIYVCVSLDQDFYLLTPYFATYIPFITCIGVLRTKNPKKGDPDTDIYARLGFSVPIYYGHPIDMKRHSHEFLGQRNHNDTTCTQFGLQAFQHENQCISRVSARFFMGIRLT